MRPSRQRHSSFHHRHAPWVRLVGLAVALVLALAACGDGDGEDTGADTETEAEADDTDADAEDEAEDEDDDEGDAGGGEGDPELSELTIGTLPIVDVAPLQIAVDEGLFEDEGLEVSLETMQGGAAAIPGLISGELDVAFGAWPSFFQAITEGIELRVIADGVRAEPEFSFILTTEDTGLADDPAGLEGTTVAVNTLNNLGEMAVRFAVEEAGGDRDAVELVEVPFPDMIPSLERGDVDAIWVVEPFTTLAQEELGAVPVVDSFIGDMEQFPVAGYQVTAEFAEDNPNTVAAVQRALDAATEVATTETDRMNQEILPDLVGLEPEVAEALSLPEFLAEPDAEELQRVVDFTFDFGILPEQLDASEYIVSP